MTGLFHHRLEALKQLLLSMGGLVEDQLERAARALLDGDRGAAQHAIALDQDVDALEIEVDEACVQLLALYQPAAGDLRFIAATMKVVTELERIGDQAVNVARCALEGPLAPELLECGLRPMAEIARGMVSESLDALARSDVDLARKVIAEDESVDRLEQDCARQLLAHANDEPALLDGVFRLAYAARCLERIGDHATNIAEMTLYTTEALIARHRRTTEEAVQACRT